MKALTRAEEEIMQQLWRLNKAFVKEIIEELPEPKPAYSTVSTIIRILEEKGFVAHNAFGKTHQYFPLISKKTYTRAMAGYFLKKYFDNSPKKWLSYLVEEEDIDIETLDQLLNEIKNQKP